MVMKITTISAVCLLLAAEDYTAFHKIADTACLYIYGTQCRTGLTIHVSIIFEVLMLFHRHFLALVYTYS